MTTNRVFRASIPSYLRQVENALQKRSDGLWAAFEAETQEERSRLLRIPAIANSKIRQKALDGFDRAEAHQERLVKFCQTHGVPVLTFWEWDAQTNPEGFQAGPSESPRGR